MNVNIAPYDVTYGNFIGGNINIVTKSGTNDFEGSVLLLPARTTAWPVTSRTVPAVATSATSVKTIMASRWAVRSSAIKLFFFVGTTRSSKRRGLSNSQPIENIAGVTQAGHRRFEGNQHLAECTYGFDPGPVCDQTDDDQDEKILHQGRLEHQRRPSCCRLRYSDSRRRCDLRRQARNGGASQLQPLRHQRKTDFVLGRGCSPSWTDRFWDRQSSYGFKDDRKPPGQCT